MSPSHVNISVCELSDTQPAPEPYKLKLFRELADLNHKLTENATKYQKMPIGMDILDVRGGAGAPQRPAHVGHIRPSASSPPHPTPPDTTLALAFIFVSYLCNID